jgi:hypothetical protein
MQGKGPTVSAAIRVVHWSKFQHYKNRNPPWIKLHRALLDNREWHALSGDASKLLAACWLIASEYDDGTIPMDAKEFAWRLRRDDTDQVSTLLYELSERGFVHLDGYDDASKALADCKQDASNVLDRGEERRGRGEAEAEAEVTEKRESSKRARALPDSWGPNDAHRELATERGVDAAEEAEAFRDHAAANARTQVDWDASFRNWLRKATPRKGLRVVKGGKADDDYDDSWFAEVGG